MDGTARYGEQHRLRLLRTPDNTPPIIEVETKACASAWESCLGLVIPQQRLRVSICSQHAGLDKVKHLLSQVLGLKQESSDRSVLRG